MPPQTRSQRRRQAARQQRRSVSSVRSAEELDSAPSLDEAAPIAEVATAVSAPRTARTMNSRRAASRAVLEPVDYSSDYAAVGIDLRLIALWSILLFVAMIALKFSGLV